MSKATQDPLSRLAMEMADLIRFKTSTLTAIGFQRNGVWGKETAYQKIEHLGFMFGALAASPQGVVERLRRATQPDSKRLGCPVLDPQARHAIKLMPIVRDQY
jgi:hypothetical protein